jgi:hypothetical protein
MVGVEIQSHAPATADRSAQEIVIPDLFRRQHRSDRTQSRW